MEFDSNAPMIIFSPHCDDSVMDCWHYLSQKKPISIFNIFMGLPKTGTLKDDGPNAVAYTKERHAEDAAALRTIVREAQYLQTPEELYRDFEPDLQKIKSEIDQMVPQCSAILAPLGIGIRIKKGGGDFSHNEHQLTRQLADSYSDIPKIYYREIPYALSAASNDFRDLIEYVARFPELHLKEIKLSDEEYEKKKTAIQLYRTQLPDMLIETPELLSYAVIGHELFWSKNNKF